VLYNRKIVHVRAPLRLSFVGGGTDFPEYFNHNPGMVVSAAIDSFVHVTVKDMFDTNVRVHHSVIETQPISSRITHNYSRIALEHFGLYRGVEVVITSDVMTAGSGLGASSALMVALIRGCEEITGCRACDDRELAELCATFENDAGTIGGLQDQFAIAYGGINAIHFSEPVRVKPLDLSPEVRSGLEERTLLVYTSVSRSSEPIQRELVNRLQGRLLDRSLGELYGLAVAFRDELTTPQPDFLRLGQILDQGWRLKKSTSPQSTNPHIDELYQFLRSQGITGGKVTGAGGGGFLLGLAETAEVRDAVIRKLYPRYICLLPRFCDTGAEIVWRGP